jgi:hypothetical protein
MKFDCLTCPGRKELDEKVLALEKFVPTPEAINALPEGIRNYIHDLETVAGDAAHILQENAFMVDVIEAMRAFITIHCNVDGAAPDGVAGE